MKFTRKQEGVLEVYIIWKCRGCTSDVNSKQHGTIDLQSQAKKIIFRLDFLIAELVSSDLSHLFSVCRMYFFSGIWVKDCKWRCSVFDSKSFVVV